MMKLEEIQIKLKEVLKPSRYHHTLGVVETAEHLAVRHGCDLVKAKYAAFLHDCAKCIDENEQIQICRKYGVELSVSELENHALIHAKSGVVIAREVYGVEDDEILHAIGYHTTGCPDMSLLDKIIYIADYIEPNRDKAPRLDVIRKEAITDIDKALFHILEDTVSYLAKSGKVIDKTTFETYEFYKNKEVI